MHAVRHRTIRRVLVLAIALATTGGAAQTATAADQGLTQFDVRPSQTAGGQATAGARADTTVALEVANQQMDPNLGPGRYPSELAKNVVADLPPGLLADPRGVPTCTPAQLEIANGPGTECPDAAQVGVVRLSSTTAYSATPEEDVKEYPVFNITRKGDQVARLGFPAVVGASAVVYVDIRVRDEGDYGATATLANLPSGISFYRAEMDLWGAPGDPSHDARRSSCQGVDGFGQSYAAGSYLTGCSTPATDTTTGFMINPTRCDAALQGSGRADFYPRPGQFNTVASTPFSVDGCGALAFAPSLSVAPESRAAGQPSGYAVDLRVPQNAERDGPATAHVRNVSVTLPEGTAISPSAANGLDACSDAQLGAGTRNPVSCPDASKIGSATIESPLLDGPLTGSIHLGTQLSSDPQSGQMYRLFLVARGSGITVRLKGAVRADPRTGQLTATFDDNPQLPFDALSLRFDGGPRAPLVNPTTCGTKTTRAAITSWAGQTVSSDSTFEIDQGCPSGAFNPSFTAGTLSPLAGAYSPFTTTIARGDGEQELSQIGLDLPPGLLGDLGSVPVCAEAQAAAGTCGAASRVGSTTVQAGSGPQPFSLPGTVSLGGPYKGAPFSLSIAVPAKAGPLDLGLVVVRSPLVVDAANAKVSAPADPLPTIVGGVPLKLRSVSITLDRQNFIFNATNCTPQAIGGTLTGTGGAVARPSVRYQADGCAKLKLQPSLKLGYSGKKDLKKGGNPKLTADLGQTFGQAAMKSVKVTLPLLSSLKPENAKALCTPAQDAAGACPAASIVGRASARTRALHEPIGGPIYFVEGTRRTASGTVVKTLPKLLLKLRGDGVSLDLRADTSVDSTGRLITTFPKVPDVPIQDFRLEIDGGKNGILTAVEDPCTADRGATVRFDGQNGARTERGLTVTAPQCGLRAAMNTSPTRVNVSYANVGAGRLTVSGRGVRTTRRTIRSATRATVVAPLTATLRRRVASGRTVRVRLTASFVPKGQKKAQKVTKTVAVRGVEKRR